MEVKDKKYTNKENLKRIAKMLYKERTTWTCMEIPSVDSFLMFSSHELDDSSIYPYWHDLCFNNFDNFIIYLIYWDDNFGFIRSADNVFIKKYIRNNPNNVWRYLLKFPSFKGEGIKEGRKHISLMEILKNIICFLKIGTITLDGKIDGALNLINLTFCDEFVVYLNKVWEDMSCAIEISRRNDVINVISHGEIGDVIFDEINKKELLEELQRIR